MSFNRICIILIAVEGELTYVFIVMFSSYMCVLDEHGGVPSREGSRTVLHAVGCRNL